MATTETTTDCLNCPQRLKKAPCGCWVDRRGTRYCGGLQIHRPKIGHQPLRCEAGPPPVTGRVL